MEEIQSTDIDWGETKWESDAIDQLTALNFAILNIMLML